MYNEHPIGIFDSGVGGTSIWMEINELLPDENIIYLADSKNAPYGNKSVDEIISLSIKNTEILLQLDSKIIVVACNTATTNAISVLREKFKVPIIGIEPAIKPAALKTHSKSIGILATKGTLSSSLFHNTSKEFTSGIEIIEVVGTGLVPLIEKGKLQSLELKSLLEKYLDPMLKANIDYLVLGCSHYRFLIPLIKKLIPKNIRIIDSGEAVAKQTQNILQQNNIAREKNSKTRLQFFSNANTDTLNMLLNEYSHLIEVNKANF